MKIAQFFSIILKVLISAFKNTLILPAKTAAFNPMYCMYGAVKYLYARLWIEETKELDDYEAEF